MSFIKTYLTPHYGTALDELDEKLFYLSVKKMVNIVKTIFKYFKNHSKK